MKYPAIAQAINDMKNEDLALRDRLVKNGELGNGYNDEMEALHNENARRLEAIIDNIGYATIDKVGESASDAAWLIIQHSIGQPPFMKKCERLLREAVARGYAKAVHLAYLSDRIAIYEGRPQLYGTGFDWDENGKLSPNTFDDLALVNERRRILGLNTLEEQTSHMRETALKEKQDPPADQELRNKIFKAWKRQVGWIK